MLNKLRFRKTRVIVEIGNDWLKILEDQFSTSGVYITNVNFTRLAEIRENLPDAISKIFKELKIDKQSVITYIPRHLATLRILELPSNDHKEINEMVSLQVGKQTPYTKEEIVFDHKIVGAGKEGYTNVILVIARRNIVTERVKTLQDAGIEIEKVTVSSEGVYNWFSMACMPHLKLEQNQTVVLIDIDSNYSDFVLINNRGLVFTRNILIGANHLIAQHENWQDKFIEELRHSIELYQARERNIKIIKMFLSGAAKNIKDLDTALSARLDISTEIRDPLRGVRIKKGLDVLEDEKFKFISVSPLVGMAVRDKKLRLDLTPSELRIHKLMEEKRKHLTIMAILVASIVMTASLILLTNVYYKNLYLRELKDKVAKITGESREIEKMRMKIDLVEKRLNAEGSSINILNEVYRLTPEEIYLTSINIEEKKQAILKGRALAMSDVFKFITTVENSPYFENVKTTYTTTKKEKDTEYAEFEIICSYESSG